MNPNVPVASMTAMTMNNEQPRKRIAEIGPFILWQA